MKKLALAVTLFLASTLVANPCDSWYFANPAGKGVIRVRALSGKLDTGKVQQTLAGLNPAEWDGLADRLKAKLGKNYEVRAFTSDEFEKSGHNCP